MDDLVQALGRSGDRRSEVSRISTALDAEVTAFRKRSLAETACRYLWLDRMYLKVRDGGHVVSVACLVAIGVAGPGEHRAVQTSRASASRAACSVCWRSRGLTYSLG